MNSFYDVSGYHEIEESSIFFLYLAISLKLNFFNPGGLHSRRKGDRNKTILSNPQYSVMPRDTLISNISVLFLVLQNNLEYSSWSLPPE